MQSRREVLVKKIISGLIITLFLFSVAPVLAVGSPVRLEIIDRTAGKSIGNDKLAEIRSSITKYLNDELPDMIILPHESGEPLPTLRVNVDVFSAGNRALRFWVGFGSGKAHLRIEVEWLDGSSSTVVDSKVYQRLGAFSLRSGQTIEIMMTDLIGRYTADFATLQTPKTDMAIEKTNKIAVDTKTKDETEIHKDIYSELIKLDDLKQKGIISEAEFETLKQKLLSETY